MDRLGEDEATTRSRSFLRERLPNLARGTYGVLSAPMPAILHATIRCHTTVGEHHLATCHLA